jgi:hypothetical protein
MLAVCIGCCWVALYCLPKELVIDRSGATAVAEIIDVERSTRGPETIAVRFTTPTGRTVVAKMSTFGWWDPGEVVKVKYAVSDPTKARLVGSPLLLITGAVYGLIGLLGGATAFSRRPDVLAAMRQRQSSPGRRKQGC